MSPEIKPKLRVSLYKYSDDFLGFILAFRRAAIKQGWTYTKLQTVFNKTQGMSDFERYNYLMQYAVIVKMSKGVRIKNGKRIPNNK